MISGILNVINVVIHDIHGNGNIFHGHQHARHATIYIILRTQLICVPPLRNKLITNQPTTQPIRIFVLVILLIRYFHRAYYF